VVRPAARREQCRGLKRENAELRQASLLQAVFPIAPSTCCGAAAAAVGTGPVAVTIRLSRASYHPSQDRMSHGYISNIRDMIALQFWQRMLIASAAAGFEAVPDRVSAASGQRLEKYT
jgi:hypothetical protein